MTDLPKQIDRRIRREIASLTQPWTVVKKRDHYFLHVADHPPVCIGNNASKAKDYNTMKTLENLRKLGGAGAT